MKLRELVARVRLHAADGDGLGIAHMPAPIELGDLLALADGSPWRVVALIRLEDSDPLGALC